MPNEEIEPQNAQEDNEALPPVPEDTTSLNPAETQALQEKAKEAQKDETPEIKGQQINELKESIEGKLESPTKQEIFELLGVNPDTKPSQEKSDEQGLYRLDFEAAGNEYEYCRKGDFPGTHQFTTTEIIETTPTTWPTPIYRYENGAWKKI